MKTVLDLLDLDFIFSQQGPLSVDDFLKVSKERGVDLERGHLDALHRAGIVVPMYRIARDMKAVRSWVRHERRSGRWEPARQAPDARIFTNGRGLLAHHAAGCVADPRSEPYRPWHQYATKIGLYPRLSPDGITYPEMMYSSEFLYSPYQSLQLTDLTPVIARMRAQRRGRHVVYAVAPQDLARSSTIRSLFATSDMLVGLSALENRYRPYIVGHAINRNFGTVEAWEQYVAAFDPVAMLAWLGWAPEQLLNYAGALLAIAHAVDPNRNVHDLIELWHPAARERLRGAALLAVDYREAAEVFLRFYEDLVAHGTAAPLPTSPLGAPGPFDGRYRPDMTKLDPTLTDYGLSPHPRVVLVLEGQTEYEIMMRRTMKLLDLPEQRSMIHLENAETIDRDLSMLAAYVTTPALGEQLGDSVLLLDRTATRFLVAVDPESAYADQAGRERKHTAWVKKICAALPPQYRNHPAIEAQIARLVHIETWGTAAFEYAHFTDEQLAAAIHKVHIESGSSRPIAFVTPERVARWRASNVNIEKIVDEQMRLSKVKLAEALWPHLEADLIARRDAGTLDQIAIARVALRAMELAQIALRQRAIDLSSGS